MTTSADNLEFLYIFENKTIKNHILEIKKTNLKSNEYFWLFVEYGTYIRRLSFIDSGKLDSGKEIRILGDKDIYGNKNPWVFVFDSKKLDLHRTDWDASSGTYVKIESNLVPKEVITIVSKYFKENTELDII